MANIKLRSTTSATDPGSTSAKGSALTHAEMDSNFILLNDEKLDAANGTATGTLTLANNGILQLNEATTNGLNYVQIKTPASLTDNYVLTLPPNDGGSGEVLTTDGSGTLTWTAKTVDTTNLVDDTTPQLGGDLDVNGNDIVSTSDANIDIVPNGTGDVTLQADTVQVGDSNADATITTNGTGDLILNTNSGTNSGEIKIFDGANGNIAITPNGTGQIRIDSNVIEQHSAAGLVINHLGQGTHNGANFGAPEGDSSGSTMLFNTGVQIEGRGQYEYPAVVMRNTSITGYNNVWAAKSRPTGSDYTTDTYLQANDVMFKFFGAGFQGTDGQGNSIFTHGSATVDLYATENHSASVNGGGFRVKTLNTGVDAASGAETTKLDITDAVKISNPKTATEAALAVEGSIRLKNASDPSNVTDSAHIYAKDDGSTSEVYVKDEAGNETKISPHNQNGEWEYLSRNVKTGKVVRINMERMIRDLETLTGRTYIENE